MWVCFLANIYYILTFLKYKNQTFWRIFQWKRLAKPKIYMYSCDFIAKKTNEMKCKDIKATNGWMMQKMENKYSLIAT